MRLYCFLAVGLVWAATSGTASANPDFGLSESASGGTTTQIHHRVGHNDTVGFVPTLNTSASVPKRWKSSSALALVKQLGDEQEALEKAHEYSETFESAFKDVADIAEFFGPEGEAVAAVFKLASALAGLASIFTGAAIPSPLAELQKEIKAMWTQINSRFDELEVQISDVKKQVIKSEIAVIFSTHEEVLLIFNSASQNLFKGSMTKEDYITHLKPYIENTGDFETSFGVIRDCISGKLQSCQVGGVKFTEQVGAALSYRPTQVANFFGYYHVLLANAANAYCSYQTAVNANVTCDTSYANSLKDFASTVSDYYANTLRGERFMYASDSNAIPPMMDDIMKKHSNKKADGAKAIMAELKQELNTYYAPVKWFQYCFVTVMKSDSEWSVHKYGHNHDRLYGSGGYKKDIYGYYVVYAWVPKYVPKLPTSWKGCMDKSYKDAFTCLSTGKYFWYEIVVNLHGASFYSLAASPMEGPSCTTEPCASNTRRIYWVSDDKKKWRVVG